jgi:cytochrome c oxidase assembly factor CtaG
VFGDNAMFVGATDPRLDWLPDPGVLAPIALLVFVYVRRFRAARREEGGRGAGWPQALAFAAGIFALLLAVASPIDGLGEEYLFSAHMTQHVLLGDIAPALLLLSLSRVIMRPATRRLHRIERALGPLASPWTGIALWLALMYLWHIPALYDAALENPIVHLLEHASFFTAGVCVWWPLIQPVPMRRPLKGFQTVGYIGGAKFGLAALGLYLTWSSTVFYPYYETVPRIWGLSAISDQNAGGAIMMVEQSLTFAIALVFLFSRMLTQSEVDEQRREKLDDRTGGSRPRTPAAPGR